MLYNTVPLFYEHRQPFVTVNNGILLFSMESRWLLCDVVTLHSKNFGIKILKCIA